MDSNNPNPIRSTDHTFDVLPEFPYPELTAEQYDILLRPLNATRVATREQGRKTLFYLESWDVRAHLNRVFGFGHWDLEMLDYTHVSDRPYQVDKTEWKDGNKVKTGEMTDMVEVIWSARMRLTVRDSQQLTLAVYTEAAVGSASGPANMPGELHDNALKTAASDALKRCAINLGTQFGLSLYNDGSRNDVVRGTLVTPHGWEKPPEPEKSLAGVGVTPSGEKTNEGSSSEQPES